MYTSGGGGSTSQRTIGYTHGANAGSNQPNTTFAGDRYAPRYTDHSSRAGATAADYGTAAARGGAFKGAASYAASRYPPRYGAAAAAEGAYMPPEEWKVGKYGAGGALFDPIGPSYSGAQDAYGVGGSAGAERPYAERPYVDRPYVERPYADRAYTSNTSAERAYGTERAYGSGFQQMSPSSQQLGGSQLSAPYHLDFASEANVSRALSVSGEFAWHYFHLMQTQPEMLPCFYGPDSQVAHGSSALEHRLWRRAVGEEAIGRLFAEVLERSGTILRSNVKTLEAQPTRDDGIVMQATGVIDTCANGQRPFAHTIVMQRSREAGSYVVLHDIFTFLDSPNPQPQPAANPMQQPSQSAQSNQLHMPQQVHLSTTPQPQLSHSSVVSEATTQTVTPPPPPPAPVEPVEQPRIHTTSHQISPEVTTYPREESHVARHTASTQTMSPPTQVSTQTSPQNLPADQMESYHQRLPSPVVQPTEIVDAECAGNDTDPEVEMEPIKPCPAVALDSVHEDSTSAPNEEPPTLATEPPAIVAEELVVEPMDIKPSSIPEEVHSEERSLPQVEPEVHQPEPEQETTESNAAESAVAAARPSAWKTIPRATAPPPPPPAAVAVPDPVVQEAPPADFAPRTTSATIDVSPPAMPHIIRDPSSYAGRVRANLEGPEPKIKGTVVVRKLPSTEPAPSTSTGAKTVWIANLEGVSDAEIERAVEMRLKGQPVEGRVVRIERMRQGSTGVIELDSEECVPLLIELGLYLRGQSVRIDLYKQSPSQIVREPPNNGAQGGEKRPQLSRPPRRAGYGAETAAPAEGQQSQQARRSAQRSQQSPGQNRRPMRRPAEKKATEQEADGEWEMPSRKHVARGAVGVPSQQQSLLLQ